jgi:hypothetical protein
MKREAPRSTPSSPGRSVRAYAEVLDGGSRRAVGFVQNAVVAAIAMLMLSL